MNIKTQHLIRINFILFMLVLAFVFYSCQNKKIPFNKIGWNEYADGVSCPPLRDLMLNDLLTNHKIIGLTYQQLLLKLGQADNNEFTKSGILRYQISAEYTWGDIVHIKALDFYFNADSVITSSKIIKFDVDL